MPEPTFIGGIETLIKKTSNNNPAPEQCTIVKNYPQEPQKADIQTTNGIITYVTIIGGNTIGAKGIVFYCNGDYNQPFAIIESRNI